MESTQSLQHMDHVQRAGLVLLFLFAVAVLGLGFLQFRSTIYGHTVLDRSGIDESNAAISAVLEDEEVRLQRIDTDQDGINDFEELTFYETSPYIADTDSDGISDKQEIDSGTDPLCPTGQDCAIFNDENIPTGTTSTSAVGSFFEGQEEPIPPDTSALEQLADPTFVEADVAFDELDPTSQQTIELLATDPDAVRALLLESGELTEEEVNNFSDELLLEVVAELLNT